MRVRFLCGCEFQTDDDSLKFDDEGFVICYIHNQRRYGWRSTGRDHSLDGLTALQVEGWELFGLVPIRDTFDPQPAEMDRRDNRDPVAVAQQFEFSSEHHEIKGSYNAKIRNPWRRDEAATQARRRLDLWDRTGFEIRDMQVEGVSHE